MIKALAKRLFPIFPRIPDNLLSSYAVWAQLKDLLKQLNINCVLDVGANRGQFASNLRRIGYKNHIISFEPIEKEFKQVARLFANDPLWRGYNYGLGSQDIVQPFHIALDSTEMSSFLRPPGDWRLEVTQIQMHRLDTIFDEVMPPISDPRILLKMDTQGYEVEVLKGAGVSLAHVAGLHAETTVDCVYEGNPCYLEVIEYCESLGYLMMGLVELGRQPDDNSIIGFTALMANRRYLYPEKV